MKAAKTTVDEMAALKQLEGNHSVLEGRVERVRAEMVQKLRTMGYGGLSCAIL